MLSVERAASYVNVTSDSPLYGELEPAIATAQALLADRLGENIFDVPEPLIDFVTLQAVGEIMRRLGGTDRVTYTPDGSPIYLSNDVLRSVLPQLAPWLPVGGIA
jgi:hypothetical protein